jgi:hypothetical protein
MTTTEALALLENTCLVHMVQIPKDNRPKILEAADILRNLIDLHNDKEEKKDE